MRRSTIREFLKHAAKPGMISFGGGLPAADLFPSDHFQSAWESVLSKHGGKALQYGESEGVGELREYLGRRVGVGAEQVLITSGAQQALDLLGRVLINPRDRIVVENPTYLALLSSWRVHRPNFIPALSDDNGLVVEQLRYNAKVLYVVPNYQNPQGTTLSLERRLALTEYAQREEMIVVEDDPYGELRYEGSSLPSLFEVSGKGEGPVIRVGTFSKVLSPGLRVGWVVANPAVIEKLVRAKQSADLHTSTCNQYIALELARNGVLEKQIPRLRAAYRERRDTMLEALQQWMPPGARWSRPAGGMFLLLKPGAEISGHDIAQAALREQVLVVPGEDFHVRGGRNTVRLNFSNCAPARIRVGMEKLGRIVGALRGKTGDLEKYRVSFSAT
jgi:2-aminoadipate transaminase